MNSHELAKHLLSTPDAPVRVWNSYAGEWCSTIDINYDSVDGEFFSVDLAPVVEDDEEE